MEALRIHVIWAKRAGQAKNLAVDVASEPPKSADFAERISRHFDGIGMERDGVAHRVPVRFWSEPWIDGTAVPRSIDLANARFNIIILLYDGSMAAPALKPHWENYIENLHAEIERRGNVDLYMAFGDPAGATPLKPDFDRKIQYARRDKWKTTIAPTSLETHLLLHIVFKIRVHLNTLLGTEGEEDLFVSHAKLDGDSTASSIVDYVNSRDNDVPLRTFYDAKALSPGDHFADEFAKAIQSGTLLAIVSDAYDSRPWCIYELTEAKRARRPIVLADIGKVRISRTYPYGANLPRVRVNPVIGEFSWIEPLLVECLSEGLRCDLFNLEVATQLGEAKDGVMILPRPPELFDIIDCETTPETVVYPDPPLSRLESDLIWKALRIRGGETASLKTLSDIQ